jgi:hypothetical protein
MEMEDEGNGETYMGQCDSCGTIPSNLEETDLVMAKLKDQLKDEAGRREEIRVCISRYFASPFPDRAPHYE